MRSTRLGKTQIFDNARINGANGIEIEIVIGGQFHDTADKVGTSRCDQDRIPGFCLEETVGRRQRHFRVGIYDDAGDHLTVLVQDKGREDTAEGNLRCKELIETGRLEFINRLRPVDIVGHGDQVAAQNPGMFLKIGLSDGQGVVDDLTRPVLEPAIKAAVQRDRRQNGHENGRHSRNHAEQGHDPHMKASSSPSAPPRLPQLQDLEGDNTHENCRERTIYGHCDHDDFPRGIDGRQPHQDNEGDTDGNEGKQDDRKTHAPPEFACGAGLSDGFLYCFQYHSVSFDFSSPNADCLAVFAANLSHNVAKLRQTRRGAENLRWTGDHFIARC